MTDARQEGLRAGLEQLTTEQLLRVFHYPKPMAVDHGNYVDGHYCPLAVGLGLHELMQGDVTCDRVHAVMTMMGYKVNNTRGKEGMFYTDARERDLLTMILQILRERGHVTDGLNGGWLSCYHPEAFGPNDPHAVPMGA